MATQAEYEMNAATIAEDLVNRAGKYFDPRVPATLAGPAALLMSMTEDYLNSRLNSKGLRDYARLSGDLSGLVPFAMHALGTDLEGSLFLKAVEAGAAGLRNRFDIAEMAFGGIRGNA